jgi:hypothetical protein
MPLIYDPNDDVMANEANTFVGLDIPWLFIRLHNKMIELTIFKFGVIVEMIYESIVLLVGYDVFVMNPMRSPNLLFQYMDGVMAELDP